MPQEVRVGGKSYETIRNTARRFDKDKDKPTISSNHMDKQKRKVEKLMARIDKPINIPGPAKDWKPAQPREFVRNVMGSSAGAGSGEFHVYRAIRKRTMQREDYLNVQKKKTAEATAFEERVAENKAKEDAKTAKKRLKRQRQKANKKKPKVESVDNVPDAESDAESDEDSGHHSKEIISESPSTSLSEEVKPCEKETTSEEKKTTSEEKETTPEEKETS